MAVIIPEETQASNMLENGFKTIVLNILPELKEKMDKELKEIRKTIDKKMNGGIEIIKRN